MAEYVKSISWHVVLTPTRAINRYRTLCGRNVFGPPVEELPAEKSCESCLRILARKVDA